MRLSPRVFQQKSLYAHAFLADVPLHDVWAIHLKGGGSGYTLQSLQPFVRFQNIEQVHPIVRGLFALRFLLGKLFRWDNDVTRVADEIAPNSYLHHLSAADQARSLTKPGTLNGPFRVIYEFENEALSEIINGTVHAFSLLAMEPVADGYQVCWAIYVKNVNWLTPFYMALIDPFRRILIYPILIRHIERSWMQRMRDDEAQLNRMGHLH
jgi:hypothetical protein